MVENSTKLHYKQAHRDSSRSIVIVICPEYNYDERMYTACVHESKGGYAPCRKSQLSGTRCY